jgi:hypothetical protein
MAKPSQRQAVLSVIVASAVGAALFLAGSSTGRPAGADPAAATQHVHTDHTSVVSAKLEFHDEMRRLWEDHVTWTRLFIVSFVDDLADLDATTNRLLQNQVDIGDAVKPYFGEAAGDRLTALLTEHITTAATLLGAAKDGDEQAFEAAHEAWYRNGRQIARFLHRANPDQWPLRHLKTMMLDHLDLTLAEAAARLEGDHAREIAGYDAVHLEILEMADMLSDGIIRRFPEKF